MANHWWEMAAGGGAAALGLALAEKGYSDVGSVGRDVRDTLAGPGGLADVISNRLNFQPYTVTTATGSNFGMTQAPSTGVMPGVNPNFNLGDPAYNAANNSPEVQAAIAAGANSQASANELAAFNMGVPDLNNDGRISNEEFTSWSGYPAWAEQQGGNFLINDGTDPGGMAGSRFTGQYDANGNPIYVQAGTAAAAGTAGTTGAAGTATGEPYIPGQMDYLLTLSPDEKTFYEKRLEDAGGMFGRAGKSTVSVEQDDGTIVEVPREQQVFDRMMAAMAPQRERDRLALEQRLQNQGRLGVRTGMFGGTPEQLALAQAQAEAENQAILNAMQFAREEQESQARLGAGMLAAGYVPQAQLLGALEPGMTAAERRRQAISQQTGAYGETYASGIQGLLQSALAQANIAGGVGGRMAEAALGGLFS